MLKTYSIPMTKFHTQNLFHSKGKISCSTPFHSKGKISWSNPFHSNNKFHGHPHSIPIASRGRPRLLPNSWIMDLSSFFASLSSHWEALQRHYFTDDLGLADSLVERSEECAEVLRASQHSTSARDSCLSFR